MDDRQRSLDQIGSLFSIGVAFLQQSQQGFCGVCCKMTTSAAHRTFISAVICFSSVATYIFAGTVCRVAYGRLYDFFRFVAMPPSENPFTVVIVEKAHAAPLKLVYRSREEAMRSAIGLRATLAPKEGGKIIVQDAEGHELQSWVEHPEGAHFTHRGGFDS